MALDIKIATEADLKAHESQIIAEINAQRNGGLMYLIDPLRMLYDIGVTLSPQLTTKLLAAYPLLMRPSPESSAFTKLKTTEIEQPFRVTVKGLFAGVTI
jgi:hypothetical protein